MFDLALEHRFILLFSHDEGCFRETEKVEYKKSIYLPPGVFQQGERRKVLYEERRRGQSQLLPREKKKRTEMKRHRRSHEQGQVGSVSKNR